MTATLLRYADFGERALSFLVLPSGESVFVSIGRKSISIHKMYLRGWIPGRRLFAATISDLNRMARTLTRTADQLQLAPLPTATQEHRDEAALHMLLDAAIIDITAVGQGKAVPGHVDALDLDNMPERPLSLVTRLALAASDGADLRRRFERVRNTPG
jgi:hypothetical protein